MSFDSLSEGLKQMEAVKNYDQATAKIKELEQKTTEQEEKINGLTHELEVEKKRRIKYGDDVYTQEKLDKLVETMIERKMKEKIQQRFENKWAVDGPQLVDRRVAELLKNYPKGCPESIKTIIKEKIDASVDSILRDSNYWPIWFWSQYNGEVNGKVQKLYNDEFNRQVNEGAQRRLNYLKTQEWPGYLRQASDQYFRKPLQDQLRALVILVTISCDKCGSSFGYSTTRLGLEEMVRNGVTGVDCANPQCKNFLTHHKVPLYLADLIAIVLNLTPVG